MKVPDKVYIRPDCFETPWPPSLDENDKYGGIEFIRKEALTEYISKRLKELWNSSSAMDDHDEYYRNPVVKELKNIAKLITD